MLVNGNFLEEVKAETKNQFFKPIKRKFTPFIHSYFQQITK